MSRHGPHLILFFCAVLAGPHVGALSRTAVAQQAGFGASAYSSGIQWQHDLDSAKAIAKQTGRLVLVHFWTPTCGPCAMLEQNVFNQPGVASALQAQFVPVKLNANEHPETAQAFGITRVPTDVILSADGMVVGRLISPPTPAAYVAETTQVARQHVTRLGGTFTEVAAAAPVPPTLNTAYANLQIPAATPAALSEQFAASNHDRRTAASGPFAALAPAMIPPAALAAHTPAPSVVTTPQPVPPQYNPVPPVNIDVPPTHSPQQVSNPYAPPPGRVMQQRAGATDLSPPAPDPRVLPPGAPSLGFDGFCPVSMRTQWKWVPGDPRWGIVHRGRTYWFAGQAEQQQFWAEPDRYSPALSGMDPVLAIDHSQQVPGKREHSICYDNLFYMFASEATLQQFTSTPERYAVGVRRAMGIQRGRLVR
jgi:YHS domain-containing protein/thiol-disulfide isomerase/thioredoxin